MLIKLVMKKSKNTKNKTMFKPAEELADPPLDDTYLDTKWLATLPIDTAEFILSVAGRPFIPGEVDFELSPVPFAKSTTNMTRFEEQAGSGTRMKTSPTNVITRQLLYNKALNALDPSIIAEQKSIYLGISEIVDDEDEDTRSDEDIAMEYLNYFFRQHIEFHKGSKLTSEQLTLAIQGFAPDYVRADLIDRKIVTLAIRDYFNSGMEKASARIDGRHQKYWRDLTVNLDLPQPPRPPRKAIR